MLWHHRLGIGKCILRKEERKFSEGNKNNIAKKHKKNNRTDNEKDSITPAVSSKEHANSKKDEKHWPERDKHTPYIP